MENLIKSTHKKWHEAKNYAANRCRRTLPDVARKLDLCEMFTGEETLPQLVELIFSPQGREFMLANQFPNIATFRKFKPYEPEKFGVYIDAGAITINEPGKVFLIGKTNAEIYCRKTRANEIILMHGASAKVYASGYSVVHIESDRKSGAEINLYDNAKAL